MAEHLNISTQHVCKCRPTRFYPFDYLLSEKQTHKIGQNTLPQNIPLPIHRHEMDLTIPNRGMARFASLNRKHGPLSPLIYKCKFKLYPGACQI